jgi:ribosomal protein S27AE
MPKQLDSYQEPCSKCLKKYPDNLENWTPCKNCPWITPSEPNLQQEKEKLTGKEKICIECEENINFLEPEKDKYLCGKVKCLRSYIQRRSKG